MSLGHPSGVSANMPSLSVFRLQIPGAPAGRSLLVPPGVRRTAGLCPEDFLYVYDILWAFVFPEFRNLLAALLVLFKESKEDTQRVFDLSAEEIPFRQLLKVG